MEDDLRGARDQLLRGTDGAVRVGVDLAGHAGEAESDRGGVAEVGEGLLTETGPRMGRGDDAVGVDPEAVSLEGVSDAALRRGVVSLAEAFLVQSEEPLEDP